MTLADVDIIRLIAEEIRAQGLEITATSSKLLGKPSALHQILHGGRNCSPLVFRKLAFGLGVDKDKMKMRRWMTAIAMNIWGLDALRLMRGAGWEPVS